MITVLIVMWIAGLLAAIIFIVRRAVARASGGYAGDGTTGAWVGNDSATSSDASCGDGGGGGGDGGGGGGGCD